MLSDPCMSFSGPAVRQWARLMAALCLVTASLLGARPAAADLFDSDTELSLTLELPLARLLADKEQREEFPATLSYADADGSKRSLQIEVSVRGNTRADLCDLPPLRIDLKPKRAEQTLFQSRTELKLVTQCKASTRYRDYLLLEHKIYQAYNLVTPLSLRTRLLSVTYLDTNGQIRKFTQPAFLIEDLGEAAARLDMERVRRPAMAPSDMDSAQQNLVEIFQYMIGNTDWSALLPADGEEFCCHNVKVLAPRQSAAGLVMIPYDFDQAGLINAEYAAVSPAVGGSSVRDRVYRGRCENNPRVEASLQRFRELRPALESLFEDARLDSVASRSASAYLRDFYQLTASQRWVKWRIYGRCLGR